jgi:hypothetical protein
MASGGAGRLTVRKKLGNFSLKNQGHEKPLWNHTRATLRWNLTLIIRRKIDIE